MTLVDAQKANDLFRTLMGEEVEERRNFIFEKGINVKDAIDSGVRAKQTPRGEPAKLLLAPDQRLG